MRKYAQIRPTFWSRGSGKKLRGQRDAQVLALYLMSAPSSSRTGLYYCPMVSILHDVGMTEAEFRAALPLISEIARYDFAEELVWLPNGCREQVGLEDGARLKAGDKSLKAIRAELEAFGSHPFALEFAVRYLPESESHPKPHPMGDAEGDAARGIRDSCMPRVPDPAPVPDRIRDRGSPEGGATERLNASGSVGAVGLPEPRRTPEAPEPVRSETPRPAPNVGGAAGQSVPDRRAPSNLREALQMTLAERAALVRDRPDVAQWLEPERWPEVTAACDAFRASVGQRKLRFGLYARDAGVRAVVDRYAEGHSEHDLCEAIRGLGDFLRSADGRSRGLSSLSAEVMRRWQAEHGGLELTPEEQAQADAIVKRYGGAGV